MALGSFTLWIAGVGAAQAASSPLIQTEQIVLKTADKRDVAVQIVTPRHGHRLRIIVFSNGANATPGRYHAIIHQWAAAGFAVVSPLHIDSEEHPRRETVDQGWVLRTRIEDFDLVLSAIAQKSLFSGALASRMAAGPVYAAGHSYGAYIAQIAAGATVIDGASGRTLTGAHKAMIGAIIALSPPPSLPGFNPPGSWRSLAAPMLVETGTADILPGFAPRWEQHLDSYNGAPAALAWAAVYTDVDHYFGGSICRLASPPNAAQRTALDRFATLSIAFMHAATTLGRAKGRKSFEQHLARLSDQHPQQVH